MLHLHLASQNLQVQLPLNWVDQFSPSVSNDNVADASNLLNLSVAIVGILDPLAVSFFDDLHFSVIAGEYAEDLQAAVNILNQIEAYITTIAANIDIPSFPRMTEASQGIFTDSFLQPVRRSLKNYRKLIDFVDRHLKYQPDTSMIFHELRMDRFDKDTMSSSANTATEIFGLNLRLAEIDHSLSYRPQTFRDLLLLQHDLKALNATAAVSEILLQKAGFLLYKLSFRLQQSKKKYDYAIEFNYSTVSHVPIPEFLKFNEIIQGHYNDGVNPTNYDIRQRAALIEFKKSTPTLSLDQFHSLIKYFKDEAKSITKLEKLKGIYNSFYTSKIAGNLNDFDRKAYEIVYCYLENNLLSLELERNKFTLANWEVKFKSHTERAEQSQNSNFFPYFKIISEFLWTEINNQFNKDQQDLEIIEKLIKKYDFNFKKLWENTVICDETDYMPYQTDLDGSRVILTDLLGAQRTCFLSSSFVIPLDYNNFKERLEFYKIELTKFNTMLNNQILIRKDRAEIKGIKTDIERADKRHIEILSIFAALVMFVSNEIQIFTKIPNMADAVAYTLFFSYGLGIFVLLIWLITRPEGLKFKSFSFIHLSIFLCFGVGLGYGVYYIEGKKTKKTTQQINQEHLEYRIDSIKKQYTLDSLKDKRRPKNLVDKPK